MVAIKSPHGRQQYDISNACNTNGYALPPVNPHSSRIISRTNGNIDQLVQTQYANTIRTPRGSASSNTDGQQNTRQTYNIHPKQAEYSLGSPSNYTPRYQEKVNSKPIEINERDLKSPIWFDIFMKRLIESIANENINIDDLETIENNANQPEWYKIIVKRLSAYNTSKKNI